MRVELGVCLFQNAVVLPQLRERRRPGRSSAGRVRAGLPRVGVILLAEERLPGLAVFFGLLLGDDA
ncbi:hypothetical protein ACFOSC_20565 [Streptantibioticus rubrisoli]|uniref:Uncharacterized protein n=1 Tax=Streptantibioticus rubrisoli TaxID=1387313 RepID=A0ABT1PHA8_9ACTN|nr:hypothetical protein [Streptantibioticus rubrisoli]MCQ4044720.1 hypothetical protein [Streptantibioticus rubrisoli]